MVEEILKLGIKGSDIVASQLKKLQGEKKKFASPAQLRVSMGKNLDQAPAGRDLAADRAAVGPLEPVKTEDRQSKETARAEKDAEQQSTTAAERWQKVGQAANTIFQGAASLSTSGLISSLGQALGETPFIGALFGVAATIGNSALTFKDKIKQAAAGWEDTLQARNVASFYSRGDEQFLKFADRSGKGRSDISTGEQRAITETLGAQYGRFSADFREALNSLYGDRAKTGERFDTRQTTSLAAGNFESLGTDQGFFLQKLSNSISSMPPSMRQSLMPQLFRMVSPEDRMTQSEPLTGIRSANASFDEQARGQDAAMLNAGNGMAANLNYASQIQGIQNQIDAGLAAAASALVSGLDKIARSISEMNDPNKTTKQKMEGLETILTGGGR